MSRKRITSAEDAVHMARALHLAALGQGLTRPNPPVGAVVVKNGRVVGEGWHRKAGGPHAEVYALNQAGVEAVGGTLYVTLEPCSSQGRTPPCTERILHAGISRVVIGAIDPNPAHVGRAIGLLRAQGIEVEIGVAKDEADRIIRPFRRWMLDGRPHIILKLGMTLDGRIADPKYRSRWITGAGAREVVQEIRRHSDAVWVGAGTVISDNPSLWPRPAKQRQPWRVISDRSGRSSPKSTVYSDEHAARTLVAVGPSVSDQRRKSYQQYGCMVLPVPAGALASVRKLAQQLGGLGALQVLCEGGGELAASLIRADLVDEYLFFYAPHLLGGTAVPGVGGKGWRLPDMPCLEITAHEMVGSDLMVRALPVRQSK